MTASSIPGAIRARKSWIMAHCAFTVRLEFNPLTVKGDSTVVETRLITLDAGSHLNKTAVSYSNLKETLPIVTGIVLHEPDGGCCCRCR